MKLKLLYIKANIIKILKRGRGINTNTGKVCLCKCIYCKKKFSRPYSSILRGGKFCSIKCFRKFQKLGQLQNYNTTSLKTFLIRQYIKNKKSQTEIANILKCARGSVSYYLRKLNIPTRSISLSKRGKSINLKNRKSYNGKNNPNWKNGISREPYPFKFTQELKEKIRLRDKNICQLCQLSNEAHIKKFNHNLLTHHIDYNKNNLKENNLITLCRICNSKVNGDRDYWFAYFKYMLERKYNDKIQIFK